MTFIETYAQQTTESRSIRTMTVKVVASSPKYLPSYQSLGAAGADLKAAITENVVIEPGKTALIPTGIFLDIPEGFEAQIRPRSGLALKSHVTVLNTPGTIDSDYRGEVGVLLINHGASAFSVTPLMRIAQMVFAPVVQATFLRVEELIATERGEGGFGHTGNI